MVKYVVSGLKILGITGAILGIAGLGYVAGDKLTPTNGIFSEQEAEKSVEGISTLSTENAPTGNIYADKLGEILKNSSTPISDTQNRLKTKSIILGSKDTVVFREVFNFESVSKLQYEILKKASNLDTDDTIYLVLDTPGGSVMAGQSLISFINSLPQNVKTVTLFAASMGFMTVQNVKGERIVADDGVLMSHRARLGIEGEIPGELFTQLQWIVKGINKLENRVANRIKMPLKEYQTLIRDEYWVEGSDSFELNMADTLGNLQCGKSLQGVEVVTFRTFFGPVDVSFSKCPLIRGPLEINFGRGFFGTAENRLKSPAEFKKLVDFINTMLYDKRKFVKDYVVNNHIKTYMVVE